MGECPLCLTDYHSKQFITTGCCRQKFCISCGLQMIKISDIGLPYFESCPFCREKFYLCLNQLDNFNKPQLLNLIKIYSNRPPLVYFHSLVSHTINTNTPSETELSETQLSETFQMSNEDTSLIHQHPNSVITNVNGQWTNMLGEVVNPEDLLVEESDI